MWTESIPTTIPSDDQLLLHRYTSDHDLQAFDALASRYLDVIRAVCRQEIGNSDLAEDAVSATLLVFAEKASSIRSNASLRAWLIKTSRLVCKNVRRREDSQMNLVKHLRPKSPSISDTTLSFVLDQALAKLTEKHRQAITLRFCEQQPLVEVGRTMGISEDAARMLVQRGLKLLRKSLKNSGIPIGIASASLLLHRKALAEKGILSPWPLRASTLGFTLPLLISPVLAISALTVVALPILAWPVVRNSIQSKRAEEIFQESSKKVSAFSTLEADLDMKVTLNGQTFGYLQKIYAQRSGLYRIDTSKPNQNRVICDGQNVFQLSAIGTPSEGYTKLPFKQDQGSYTPAIDAFLGWDVIKTMSNFLVGVSPKVKADGVSSRQLPDKSIGGRLCRVIEILHADSKASIKLYFAPNGVIEREEASVQVLYSEDDGHGNRNQKYTTETFEANLKNVRFGRPIPAETFRFDETKHRSLTQPDLVSVGAVAPDFIGANPLSGQSIHLADLVKKRKATLLDFWFAGCAPCRAEMPKLSELQTRLGDKGLSILCVNGMDDSKVIKEIFVKENLAMTPVLAPMRKWGGMDQCAWDYGVKAYPTQFLIDSKGRVVWVGHGIDASLMTALSDLGVE